MIGRIESQNLISGLAIHELNVRECLRSMIFLPCFLRLVESWEIVYSVIREDYFFSVVSE